MRLLLLLSALLAALSGAGASARAPQAHAVEAAVRIAAPAAVKAHANVLSSARAPASARIETTSVAIVEPAVSAPRLWTTRRRE